LSEVLELAKDEIRRRTAEGECPTREMMLDVVLQAVIFATVVREETKTLDEPVHGGVFKINDPRLDRCKTSP
jgi:hypothetical protein